LNKPVSFVYSIFDKEMYMIDLHRCFLERVLKVFVYTKQA